MKQSSFRLLGVAALGYLVDVYDLVLFGIVRVASLRDLGLSDSDRLIVRARLLNLQMAGMLVGGLVWGWLADRWGRRHVLFASIALYSLANLANGAVTSVWAYAILRFIAGFGLAGELGAAVTLVSESVDREQRSLGAAVIGCAGFAGAVIAALVGSWVSWRSSFYLGGALGLVLLAARLGVSESRLFAAQKSASDSKRVHPFKILFLSRKRFALYLRCLLVGVPIWYISGVITYFAPEFAKSLAIQGAVSAGPAILWCYVGSLLGDPICALFSQRLRSRKQGILIFLILSALLVPAFFGLLSQQSPTAFYGMCLALGFANGYWTLFVAMTAEQFGTNVRGTVTSTIPNFVRATVIPMTSAYLVMRPQWGDRPAALTLGLTVITLSLLSLLSLPDTFSRDLNFSER